MTPRSCRKSTIRLRTPSRRRLIECCSLISENRSGGVFVLFVKKMISLNHATQAAIFPNSTVGFLDFFVIVCANRNFLRVDFSFFRRSGTVCAFTWANSNTETPRPSICGTAWEKLRLRSASFLTILSSKQARKSRFFKKNIYWILIEFFEETTVVHYFDDLLSQENFSSDNFFRTFKRWWVAGRSRWASAGLRFAASPRYSQLVLYRTRLYTGIRPYRTENSDIPDTKS